MDVGVGVGLGVGARRGVGPCQQLPYPTALCSPHFAVLALCGAAFCFVLGGSPQPVRSSVFCFQPCVPLTEEGTVLLCCRDATRARRCAVFVG